MAPALGDRPMRIIAKLWNGAGKPRGCKKLTLIAEEGETSQSLAALFDFMTLAGLTVEEILDSVATVRRLADDGITINKVGEG